jgi:uncharacterized protein (DUF1697 family)
VKYAAFLRAINVGGRTVTMARLREVLVRAELQEVTTFIASGNVLFESRSPNAAALERRIEKALLDALGFEVETMVRTHEEVAAAAAQQPFGVPPDMPGGVADYVAFLKHEPDAPAVARLMGLVSEADALHVIGRELYWRRHDRAASRFTGSALERALGMAATVRNLNTVQKVAALQRVATRGT